MLALEFGSVEAETSLPPLRLVEREEPQPGPDEVLIDVRATALNRADLLQVRGFYPPPPGESEIPGLECAGEVVAVGADVVDRAVGDRVMALLAGGGHATRVTAPASQTMLIPDRFDFNEGAALPEVAITSWTNLVVEGRLCHGQSVLISGAASGVGTFAVQLARELGARVLVAGRDLERLERLRDLGADAECRLEDDLADAARAFTDGVGVDLVLDLVGGEHVGTHLAALRRRGRLVLVGLTAGARAQVDLGLLLRQRLHVIGSVLRSRSRAEKAGLIRSFSSFAASRMEDGRLRPIVDRVVPFSAIEEAYRALDAGGVWGKIVLDLSC